MTTRREPSGGSLPTALRLVERLRQTVTAETEDIAQRGPVDYAAYSLRKNQALLELSRLLPTLGGARSDLALSAALAGLNAEIEINHHALGIQLAAAVAVTDIIARAIRDGQSDGTYDSRAWRTTNG
jgi:hypothetical protein